MRSNVTKYSLSALSLGLLLLFLGLCPQLAQAQVFVGATGTGSGTGPVQVGTGATWVLPANQGACGPENTTACEQTLTLNFSQPFTTSGGFQILDTAGDISDSLNWLASNPANGGNGSVTIMSDPVSFPVGTNLLPVLCKEDDSLTPATPGGGCIGTFSLLTTGGTTLGFTAGFDGEVVFDPFKAGFDTSDGISVTGAQVVPEPASLLLLGTGLVGLGGVLRRKIASIAS